MSKDDLVYLSMKNIAEQWKFFKANEHGVFCEVKGTWENFFKIDKDPRGLEDFMIDREQDTPRDIDL